MADEDPLAEVDWGNVEEVGSDGDNDDDNDMDDLSGEDSDEEESDNDDDDDDGISDKEIEYMETFRRTFHNGNYDKEFDDALNLERSDLVSDMHTHASYNKPDD